MVKEKPGEAKEDVSQVLPFNFNKDLFAIRAREGKKLTQGEKSDDTHRELYITNLLMTHSCTKQSKPIKTSFNLITGQSIK